MKLPFRGPVLGLCLSASLSAAAELSNDPMLGLGLRSRPAYEGSESQHTELVPVVRYLGPTWFVRSTQGVLEGGTRLEFAPGLHAGAQLAYEPGRRTAESDLLAQHAVTSIGRGASLGLHLEWDADVGPVPVTLLGRLRRHTDSDRGTQADLRLSVGAFKNGPVAAGLFVQGTWADRRSAQAFYGITPDQATITGLPAFEAGSGWLSASGGLLWSIDLGRNWIAVGNLALHRVQGDAARSPLNERRWDHEATAGLAWRL